MYNNRNNNPFGTSRQAVSTRAMSGRSRPTSAVFEQQESIDLPKLDERIGNRGCDGSMRDSNNQHTQEGYGWGLMEHPLAMVYSPYQFFRDIYSPDAALNRGTMFAELDLPFEGDKRKTGGCC